eukprot:NODE_141_length_17903_cov_0.288643.p5 type:complete len:265 gc:universal NODE_141_length_17903_cov_0.288643:14451-15245(+)
MKPMSVLRGHYGPIKAIDVLCGKLISFGLDGKILSWDLKTKRPTELCTTDEIRYAKVWNDKFIILNSHAFKMIKINGEVVHEIGILPSVCNFDLFATTALFYKNEEICLLDLNTFNVVNSLKPASACSCLMILEETVVAGFEDGTLIIHDKNLNPVQSVKHHVEPIMALYSSGGYIYSGGPDYFLTRYHLNECHQILLPSNGVSSIAMINGKLWIAGWKGVYVVDEYGSLCNNKSMQLCNSIISLENAIYVANEDSRIYKFSLL